MKRTLIPALALLAGTLSAAPLRVTAVRHWSMAEATRVAVEVSGDFEFRFERIHNPERIFFDISGARPLFRRQSVLIARRSATSCSAASAWPRRNPA